MTILAIQGPYEIDWSTAVVAVYVHVYVYTCMYVDVSALCVYVCVPCVYIDVSAPLSGH